MVVQFPDKIRDLFHKYYFNYWSKLRSWLEYYVCFFRKVLTALYCDADGEYAGWKRTDTSAEDAALPEAYLGLGRLGSCLER